MIRLVGLAAVLAVSVACVDLRLRLELARDGSGRFESDVKLGPKTTDLMRQGGGDLVFNQLMPAASSIEPKALKALGVEKLDVVVGDEAGWSGHTALRFRSLSAVDQLVERGALESPRFALRPVANGTWEVSSARGASSSPFDRQAPEDMFSGLEDLGEDEMMGLMLGLLGELSMFRVVMELEVPGEVVEVTPLEGAEVTGGTVRWTLDLGKTAGAALAGLGKELGGQGGPPLPPLPTFAGESFQVRFMPARPMKPAAAWPR